MRQLRHEHGALDLETIEARPVFVDGKVDRPRPSERKNRAKELIEDFMIAANGVDRPLPRPRTASPRCAAWCARPERWQRIVELAARARRAACPPSPTPARSNDFLGERRQADPQRFPELSLSVVKLLGAGEYVARPARAATPPGHFGLAVKDYTHSTAPNRRYPDLITQRLVKAALRRPAVRPTPTTSSTALAAHCTAAGGRRQQGRAPGAQVGRRPAPRRRASASSFDAIVTGASEKGTWVRIFHPPVEGRLVRGFAGARRRRPGARAAWSPPNVERGFIDFAR